MGIVMVEAEAVIVVAEEATGAEEGGGISIGVGWCLQFYPERGQSGQAFDRFCICGGIAHAGICIL